jgi:hypothetical protein
MGFYPLSCLAFFNCTLSYVNFFKIWRDLCQAHEDESHPFFTHLDRLAS